jgi:hypothetical protein
MSMAARPFWHYAITRVILAGRQQPLSWFYQGIFWKSRFTLK